MKMYQHSMVHKARNNRCRVNLFILILMLPILGENVLSSGLFGDQITNTYAFFSSVCILVIFIANNGTINRFASILIVLTTVRLLIYAIIILNDVVLFTNNRMVLPYGTIGYLVLFLLIDVFDKNNRLAELFKSMSALLTILVFINFFFSPDKGLLDFADFANQFIEAITTGYTNSRNWFFGHRNMIFIHHLMWILFTGIYYSIVNKNYRNVFVFQAIFTFIVAIYSWNSTMMLCTAVMFFIYMLRNNVLAKITAVQYTLIYIILEVFTVFLRLRSCSHSRLRSI